MKPETMLLRQVHPSFVQAGRVTSQAFRPTPKDEGKLSAYDGDQIDAPGSWTHYTETLGLPSVGTLGLTVAEFEQEDLVVIPDGVPFAEHVSIDYSAFDRGKIEKKAKRLKKTSVARGWLYEA